MMKVKFPQEMSMLFHKHYKIPRIMTYFHLEEQIDKLTLIEIFFLIVI